MKPDCVEFARALGSAQLGDADPYFNDFINNLVADGFSPLTIEGYVRAIVHLHRWAGRCRTAVQSFDDDTPRRFRRHLTRCKCSHNKGVFKNAKPGVTRWLAYLRERGVIPASTKPTERHDDSRTASQFGDWMMLHRGVMPGTARRYQRVLRPFIAAMGGTTPHYDVGNIRRFVLAHLKKRGRRDAKEFVTAVRAFLRYLVADGQLSPEIADCVPAVPQWRLSSLPQYLDAPDVERVVNNCDRSKAHGLRDRAVLLLLARLGLRAGDVVMMTCEDIDWQRGTLRVHGKSRREVLLPLSQEVGDAVLAYIEHGRRRSTSNRVFLSANAPTRPLMSSVVVSGIVRLALTRAGIQNAPSKGAHLLRHSAATAMLRAGGSLDTIATVLRHQSPDTTAHYAKVDVAMLREVTQPWPGGASC